MLLDYRKNYFVINTSITIVCWTIVMLLLFPSCSDKKHPLAAAIQNRDSLPIMKTLGVSTLISDSGVTRYRITTKEWLIYDRKKPAYWSFEKGLYLEKFDSTYHIDASIKADTAYYFSDKKLWELRGHVLIKNLKGDKFSTSQLFWDQSTEKVYSNKFIRIEQKDKVITGQSFESNQQMTIYTIKKTVGAIPIVDKKITPPVSATAPTPVPPPSTMVTKK